MATISLVPMVDVLLILLVFFMVTSTYLDLDMIPASESREDAATGGTAGQGTSVLVSLRADGSVTLRGRRMDVADIGAAIAGELARNPLLSVLILPSGAASTQDLVTVLDLLTRAGSTRVRVIRLEAQE